MVRTNQLKCCVDACMDAAMAVQIGTMAPRLARSGQSIRGFPGADRRPPSGLHQRYGSKFAAPWALKYAEPRSSHSAEF